MAIPNSQHRSEKGQRSANGAPVWHERAQDRIQELALPQFNLSVCPPDQRTELLQELQAAEFMLIVGNDLHLISLVVDDLARRFVGFAICDKPTAGRLGIAVGEAMTNAIVHGNLEVSSAIRDQPDDAYEKQVAARRLDPRFRKRRVRVICQYSGREGRVTVRDEGPGFEVTKVADPTREENLNRPYGRGILLMRAFFDEVHYSASGNAVTMIKRAAADAPSA